MNENVIYRQQWKGKRTGWNYELWVVPYGTTEFTDFPFIELPHNTFKITKLGTGYDKRKIGLLKLPVLELEHNRWEVPPHSDYDLFRNLILNPNYKYSPSGYNSTIQSGTLYILFCHGAGYSDEVLFSGVQQRPAKGEFDLKAQKLKIRVNDLFTTITNCISMHDVAVKYLNYLNDHPTTGYKSSNCYFNVVSLNGSQNDCVIMRPPKSYTYYFAKRKLIWSSVSAIMIELFNSLSRGLVLLDSSFKIQPPLTIYFKQSYDGSGGTNGELTEEDLYLLVCVGKPVTNMFDGLNVVAQNEWKGGYIDYKEESGLFNNNTCIYDYLKDVYEDSLCKAIQNYIGLATLALPIFNSDTSSLSGSAFDTQYTSDDPIEFDLTYFDKIELKDSDSIALSATSSLTFSVGNDIQKYDSKSNASQNETSENIPIMFNNMPEAIIYEEYSSYYSDTRWHLGDAFKISNIGSIGLSPDKESGLEHINGLFYIESSSPFTADSFIRVSEQCSTKIAEGDYTGTIPNNTLTAFSIDNQIDESVFYDRKIVPTLMLEMQLQSCKPKIQADAFKQIYRSPNITDITIDVDFDYNGGKPGSFWYRAFTKEYTLNLEVLYPELTTLNSHNWYVLNIELDLENEISTLDLTNRTYTEE